MAETALFEQLCQDLEQRTELARLAARGAMRLALKESGLEAATLTAQQATALLRQVLPAELRRCGVADPGAVCADLARGVAASAALLPVAAPAPEDMFRRLRGR
jgi:hypothetical protein